MPVTIEDILRLGPDKLNEFLGIEDDDELAVFIESLGFEDFFEFLDEYVCNQVGLCSCCGNNYIDLDDYTLLCSDCQMLVFNKF